MVCPVAQFKSDAVGLVGPGKTVRALEAVVLVAVELVVVLLVSRARRPEPGSRWSARSGARTNDLDAGEERRRGQGRGRLARCPFGWRDALR